MAATFTDAKVLSKKLLSRPQITLRAKPSSTCSTDKTGNPCTSASARYESIISRVPSDDSSRMDMVDMDGETFTFDHIKWADASQEQVYKATTYPFVEKTLQGYNATILAYGATRTGKSYTMGTLVPEMKNNLSNGLIQRSLGHIFEEPEIQVSASAVEVFNEKVHDLLNHGVELTVHEGAECCARIKKIKSLEDGFHLVRRAFRLRQEHSTSGSQSHAVLTLHLKVKDGENCFESKLNLIDLAGSKVEQPKEASKDLGERCCFEESLTALARAMVKNSSSLKDLFNSNSILTSVLKGLLNANCLVSLIACVSLEANDHKENLRTLLFADVARSMKIVPKLGAASGNSQSSKLVSDSAAGSSQTEAIASNQDRNTTCKLSTQPNVKNCVVVLKQCKVDSYESDRNEKPQKCDESTERQNPRMSSPDNRATRSPLGTPSTVSISRLATPNAEENNYQRNTCTDEKTWTCFEDSFSISPLGENSSENLHNLGDEEPPGGPEYYLTCECACRCSLPVTPQPAEESVPVAEPTTDEIGEKQQLSLADNVSQLSICSEEQTEIPVPCCSRAGDSLRSDNTTSDYVHELERLEMMRRLEVVNRMKRRGATLTADFSEPGPSGLSKGPTPRKVQKFEDDEPSSKVHSIEGRRETDNSDSEDEKDFVDTKNVENSSKEKQKAQNEYILGVLNSCSVKHLQMLPRIGSKTAISIYQYRLIHGEFKSLNDLKNLPMWTLNFFNKFLMANNVTLE